MTGIKKVFCAALRAMTVPEWKGAVILLVIISKCEDTRIVAPFLKRYFRVYSFSMLNNLLKCFYVL